MKFKDFEKLLQPTQPVNIFLDNFDLEPLYAGIYGDMENRVDAYTLTFIRTRDILGIETLRFTEEINIVLKRVNE